MKTLLIANRGEIARRVIRTARRLGWRTVAVHTDLDAQALHVREADQAYRVESYLDPEEIVRAAQAFGASHVHPGYGFLSERADFVRTLEARGIALVGPGADVMDAMGRKDRAREVAVTAGVPVVPSYGLDDDPTALAYPVLVKAAAGGGGKGMRIVRGSDELAEALAAARREATKAFGDDTMLIEKYVELGRHVEVQVMGDDHGQVVHLFERDCSTQRRHQKVLEEAPAPTLTPELRDRITTAGAALARAVGYTNAGTVEFLLDAATEEFYFLEMNTRLQVEHPVTEEVVRVRGERIDLVELQLRVAEGEPLRFGQEDVTLEGHAVEARVYAEDPAAGFLPQAGTATIVRWPEGVRVDHALENGQVVSTAYDPMLGKVVAHGADREMARGLLVDALDRTSILGLSTNTGFLRSLVAGRHFAEAAIDTAWLDRSRLPEGLGEEHPRAIAAWTDAAVRRLTAGAPHPFGPDGWRSGGPSAPFVIELDRTMRVHADGTVEGVPGVPGQEPVRVEPLAPPADHTVDVRVVAPGGGATRYRAVVNADAHAVEVVVRGERHVFGRPDVMADHGAVAGDGTLTAPMPGTVLDVRVTRGQQVEEGVVLGTLEAMKMELALKAPFAGTVTEVGAAIGDQVALGATLFVVEPEEGDVVTHRPERVTIYEVGPRDGLQNESAIVPVAVKAEFCRRLLAAGLPVVEATSFVHPRWVPQLADAAELMTELVDGLGEAGRDLPVLVPNERGLDRALELGLRHVAIFGSATETFAQRNLNRSLDEQFAMFEPVVRRAREAGLDVRAYVSMCFGDPWEGRVPVEQVTSVGRRLLDLGASQLSIGDTIGVGTADQVVDLVDAFGAEGVAPDRLAMHFHDTYGQALANAYAALGRGITTFDASAGGLGGCPYAKSATGNLATEDLVWMLTGLGIDHGVDLDAVVATSVWLARHLGRPSPSAVVRALAPASES